MALIYDLYECDTCGHQEEFKIEMNPKKPLIVPWFGTVCPKCKKGELIEQLC